MRLNGPRRKSRDTDGHDITGNDTINEQVEARLREAADFDPGDEPAYDFIAVALRHRRAPRASLASLALTGLAGMSAAVILAVVATLIARGQTDAGAGLIPTPKGYDGTIATRSAGVTGMTGVAGINAAKQEERTDLAPPLPAAGRSGDAAAGPDAHIEMAHMTRSAARRGHRLRTESRSQAEEAEEAPEVHWHTESVQRYTTGVLTSGWMLHQAGEHGEVSATPVTLDVPLHTGETPLPVNHGDKPSPPSLTLTSVDGGKP